MMVRLEQRILSTLHLILRVPPFWPDRKLPSNVLQKKYSRMENMRAAAEILKGRKVAKGVRCIVIPATQDIWLQSMHEGLFDICLLYTSRCV